jgi:DNA-binding transcriptional LysR family regulator
MHIVPPVDYELLQTLVEVGQSATFARAAERLRITTSAVSQRLKLLEKQLGLPLFERIGRQNQMTAAARELCNTLQSCFDPIEDAVSRLRSEHAELRGIVRIGGPAPFSRLWMRPRLAELKRRHPDILPEVQLDMAWVLSPKLVAGEIDLCIIVGPVEQNLGLESRLIYTEEFVAVAAPAYLKAHGTPRTFDEFAAHPFIVYDENIIMLAPWWRTKFGRRAPLPQHHACRVGNLDEMLALAEAGVGLTVLPSFFVEQSLFTRATVVLEPRVGKGAPRRSLYPIHLAWRRTAVDSARVRVVRELLLDPNV